MLNIIYTQHKYKKAFKNFEGLFYYYFLGLDLQIKKKAIKNENAAIGNINLNPEMSIKIPNKSGPKIAAI